MARRTFPAERAGLGVNGVQRRPWWGLCPEGLVSRSQCMSVKIKSICSYQRLVWVFTDNRGILLVSQSAHLKRGRVF